MGLQQICNLGCWRALRKRGTLVNYKWSGESLSKNRPPSYVYSTITTKEIQIQINSTSTNRRVDRRGKRSTFQLLYLKPIKWIYVAAWCKPEGGRETSLYFYTCCWTEWTAGFDDIEPKLHHYPIPQGVVAAWPNLKSVRTKLSLRTQSSTGTRHTTGSWNLKHRQSPCLYIHCSVGLADSEVSSEYPSNTQRLIHSQGQCCYSFGSFAAKKMEKLTIVGTYAGVAILLVSSHIWLF